MNPVTIGETRVEIGHIKDLKTWSACGYHCIKIDRSSPYGNQFVMKDKTDAERNRVCDAFGAWVMKQETKQKQLTAALLAEVLQHKRVVLLCWCAPSRCHGESWQDALKDEYCTKE